MKDPQDAITALAGETSMAGSAAAQSPRTHSSYSSTLCRGATQAGPAIQPTPPIIITQAGMCAEAANTSIRPSTLLMMESSRPVLNDASFR